MGVRAPLPSSRTKASRHQRTGKPKASRRCLQKIGLAADPVEIPVLPEQVPGAGRAEMATMRRGFSHATTTQGWAAMSPPTIPPPNAAGRGRAPLGAQYIKSSLAPPLPACERAPAADVRSRRGYGCRLHARSSAPSGRSQLSVDFRGRSRSPYGEQLGSNLVKSLGNAGEELECNQPTAMSGNQISRNVPFGFGKKDVSLFI